MSRSPVLIDPIRSHPEDFRRSHFNVICLWQLRRWSHDSSQLCRGFAFCVFQCVPAHTEGHTRVFCGCSFYRREMHSSAMSLSLHLQSPLFCPTWCPRGWPQWTASRDPRPLRAPGDRGQEGSELRSEPPPTRSPPAASLPGSWGRSLSPCSAGLGWPPRGAHPSCWLLQSADTSVNKFSFH